MQPFNTYCVNAIRVPLSKEFVGQIVVTDEEGSNSYLQNSVRRRIKG